MDNSIIVLERYCMDFFNLFYMPLIIPLAQTALYDCSKDIYLDKHTEKAERQTFEKVIRDSVYGISSKIDIKIKESIVNTIIESCKRLEEANISAIVEREFKQSGIENAVSEKVASEICLNALDEIDQIPAMRSKISYEKIISIEEKVKTIMFKDDARFREINCKLDDINTNQEKAYLLFAEILKVLKNTIDVKDESNVNETNTTTNEFIDNFTHKLFLEDKMEDGKIVTLKDVYIPNSFKILDYPRDYEISVNDNLLEFISDFIKNQISPAKYHVKNGFNASGIWALFIKGLPGSGKSSLFYYLANKKEEDATFFSEYKFFFIKLIDVYDAMDKRLSVDNPLGDIEKYLDLKPNDYNQVVIVLDGLDEICIARDLDIRKYCNNLIDAATSRKTKIIITTRLNYINISHEDNKNVINIQLYNLSPKQLEKWCDKYFAIHNDLITERECAENNIRYLIDNHEELLADIFAVPLLFYMIVVSKIDISQVKNIGELYDAVFAELQSRDYDEAEEDYRQRHRISKRITKELARQIAIEISYKMYENKTLLLKIHSKELQDAIANATREDYCLKEEDKKEIESLFPITFFYKDSLDVVEFAHKTIMEFFTAEKIYQEAIKLGGDFDSFIEQYILNPNIITNEVMDFIAYFALKESAKQIKLAFPNLLMDLRTMIQEKKTYKTSNTRYIQETNSIAFKTYWFFLRNILNEDATLISQFINDELVKGYICQAFLREHAKTTPFLDNYVIPFDFSRLRFMNYIAHYCCFEKCIFNYAEFENCVFTYSDFTAVSLNDICAIGELSFSFSDFSYAGISFIQNNNGAILNSVKFMHCDLTGASIHDSDISNIQFDSTNLMRRTEFKNLVMNYSQFINFIQSSDCFENITLVPGNDKSEITEEMAKAGHVNKKDYLKNYIYTHIDVSKINGLEKIFKQVYIL